MNRWIAKHSTRGLACSQLAAADLFGPAWKDDPRWSVLHYGIDLSAFPNEVSKKVVRAELGIIGDAFVVGNVGSFTEQKNHTFLVDIFAEVVALEVRARLLLVGDGPLRKSIESKVVQLGLGDRVIFAGIRDDVPRLMMGAMDVLLFPSLWEGLPVTLLEAQAAGLPCVCSEAVGDEAVLAGPLVASLDLNEPARLWAEAVCRGKAARRQRARQEALAELERTHFTIGHSVAALQRVYSCVGA